MTAKTLITLFLFIQMLHQTTLILDDGAVNSNELEVCMGEIQTFQDNFKKLIKDIKDNQTGQATVDALQMINSLVQVQKDCTQISQQDILDYVKKHMGDGMKECFAQLNEITPELKELLTDMNITVRRSIEIVQDLVKKVPTVFNKCTQHSF